MMKVTKEKRQRESCSFCYCLGELRDDANWYPYIKLKSISYSNPLVFNNTMFICGQVMCGIY